MARQTLGLRTENVCGKSQIPHHDGIAPYELVYVLTRVVAVPIEQCRTIQWCSGISIFKHLKRVM